jgi:hypothetical protein
MRFFGTDMELKEPVAELNDEAFIAHPGDGGGRDRFLGDSERRAIPCRLRKKA